MTLSISNPKLTHRLVLLAAVAMLVAAMGGTWTRSASAAPPSQPQQAVTKPSATALRPGDDPDEAPAKKSNHKQITGKLNLNTASEDQLMLLPTVGPAKAERIITWRTKNGGFKRTADLRRVKGFGYKTFKKLEAYLDIKGDTTLAAK
ncbi:MAG TPA: helix-hairpin-helix domain-containing protein [Kofleriaceae bacterium]|jgi:competence protein ComEA|nr:helix-hairpin-helix domain-containing protein [Kofleriaceae bacterium]